MTDTQQANGHKPPEAPEVVTVPRDTSYEHQLDDTAPKPEPVHDGDGIAIPALGGERLPVIPPHLRTWEGIRSTIARHLDAARFHISFHALRSPWYLMQATWWAIVGIGRVANAQRQWWWVTEQSHLRSKAVVDGNSPEWRALHTHVIKRRSYRGAVLAAEAIAIAVALSLIALLAPWWAWLITAAAVIPPSARAGRPKHQPIIRSAVTTPLIRRISSDNVIRAYERAGLCTTDPKKPADHLGFGSTMTRDALDKGSQVVVYLPFGGTFDAVVSAKARIASGLDVAESQVYFTRDRQSERRHTLRVLDTDPLAEPAGRTPLLDCKQRSIWRKMPFGLDQFGRKVAFCLLWVSLLIGAQPRRGKTFSGRLLALYAALDPYVDIILIDGKSSRDWLPVRYVAHRFIQGTHPTKDGNPVDRAFDALYELDRHIVHVNDELKKLPVSECPEGKLTEKLYRRPGLHVKLLIMEEFQCFPAGTLVGEKPIEQITVGDPVPSWDESTGQACESQVTHLFRSRPQGLVRVWWEDGTSLVCTPAHPLMTRSGWQRAVALTSTSEVLAYGSQEAPDHRAMLGMRHQLHARTSAAGVLEEDRAGVVLAAVPPRHLPGPRLERAGSGGRQAGPVAAHDRAESVEGSSRPREDRGLSPCIWAPPESAGREWPGIHGAADAPGPSSGLAHGGHRADWPEGPGYPDPLQTGHRQPGPDDRGRGRRQLAWDTAAAGARPAQDGVAHWRRVDRVEVLQPGSDGRYGGLCPDGHVYNIEVARTHVYRVADGIVAHNCYFELDDQKRNKEMANLLSRIGALGPAAGVIPVSLSQKPSGVGAGDVQRLFNRYRDNHILRFGLRCANRDVSNAILGNEAYGEGYDCSGLPLGEEYKGIGILYGLTDEAPTVRTYLADGEDADVICLAARKIREKAGTLSGDALGIEVDDPDSDIITDLEQVFGADPGLWWEVAAERLAARFPSRYADITGDAVRSSCARRGVPSVDVRMPPTRDGEKHRGCRKADLGGADRR